MLCAPIKRGDFHAIKRAVEQADIVELRLDLFQPKNLKTLRKACTKPIIFTMKSIDEAALSHAPDYIDLPYTTSPQVFASLGKRFPKIQRICSYHHDEKTPDLNDVWAKMQACRAEIYKLATWAQSTNDAFRMLHFVRKTGCVGICMGELGEITRILAPVVGAPWTYAPIDAHQQTAPGQLLLHDLVHCYYYRSLSRKTALYGLIGDPVSLSVSHSLYNSAFRQLGLDAVYVKMKISKEELPRFFELSHCLGFQGLGVTMPLKEAIIKGRAINTLGMRGGKIVGWNTDGVGALDVIEKRMCVRGKKMVLVGAGGAANAIAHEAKKRGAHLTILNRTEGRGRSLANEVGGAAYPLEHFEQVAEKGYELLVNCTSVGMGDDPRLPISAAHLLEHSLVIDIISCPRITPLLAAAKQKGCQTIEGIELLIQQAKGQFCHWFEIPYE